MMDTNRTLENLKSQIQSIKIAEKRLIVLNHLLEDTEHELRKLSLSVDKEYRDVKKLEKTASVTLFKKFLGNVDQKLAKEKEEYLQAILRYDDFANKMKLYEFEKEILSNKISKKNTTYLELENYIKQNASNSGLASKHPLYDGIQRLDNQINDLEQVKIEINEAISATKNLITHLKTAEKNLSLFDKSADSGIVVLYYEQIQYLKNIRQVISMIDLLEQQLNKELMDINKELKSKNLYTPYVSFFESMSKAAVLGWISSTHLKRSKECIRQNINNSNKLIRHLKSHHGEADQQLINAKNEKILYLENL